LAAKSASKPPIRPAETALVVSVVVRVVVVVPVVKKPT
jgi:hypothetical protein